MVDVNNVMTLALDDEGDSAAACRIIASSLYNGIPDLSYAIDDISTGIENPEFSNPCYGEINYSEPFEVYTISGLFVGDSIKNLAPGIYIIRQGCNTKKIAVK